MKIKVDTLEELLGEVETKDQFKIILPFLKKISELEEKNEALEEKNKELGKFEGTELINENNENLSKENLLKNIHHLENEIDFLNDENENLEEINVRIQNRILKLRNIFGSITKGITLETLYGKIKGIGDLIGSDLSEQIELIKTINENFREGQKEIKTIRIEKDEIEIKCGYLQKENEEIKEKNNNLVDTNQKLSDDLINQNGKVHILEEEIDLLKSENERLNNQIIDLQMKNKHLQEDIFRRNEND